MTKLHLSQGADNPTPRSIARIPISSLMTHFAPLHTHPLQYHRGFREQVEKWPVHPLDVIIEWIRKHPKARIADFGCGEARLAATVPNKVKAGVRDLLPDGSLPVSRRDGYMSRHGANPHALPSGTIFTTGSSVLVVFVFSGQFFFRAVGDPVFSVLASTVIL